MTMRAVVLFLCVATLAATGLALEFPCQFSTKTNGKTATFDLSALYNPDADHMATDPYLHTYAFQVCGGYAKQQCAPATWTPAFSTGFAIQMWGAKPKQANLTADCEVLARSSITASALEEEGTVTGISLSYAGVAASDSDPYWCQFDPSTGAQTDRELIINLKCAQNQDEPLANIQVIRNATYPCHYMFNATSKYACADVACYHGDILNGQCVCDQNWGGPKCDQFTGNCAVGATCNVCKECCAGYSANICEACVSHECPAPVCSSTSTCTTCKACCVDWLPSGAPCDKCVKANCPATEAFFA